MTDIPALAVLSTQIKQFEDLPDPPTSYDGVGGYKSIVENVLHGSRREVETVRDYVDAINEKLKQLSDKIKQTIKLNQDAIQKIFDTFVPAKFGVPSPKYLEQLKLAHELQQLAKQLMNDRLNELIHETEIACAKVKDGVALTLADLDNLKGSLNSWKNAKEESFKEEERKRKEEQRKKEEAERKRREEIEKKKREEEERRKREEEERKRREKEAEKRAEEERLRKEEAERLRIEEELRKQQEKEERERKKKEEEERKKEEAARKAEEERLRKEEDERLQKEEELRKQREEEERKKHEEEEKRRREEEEKRRKEEEELRKREEIRLKLEAEKRERERLKKEAEELAWRKDPNNWLPVVYKRGDADAVDGRRAYHGGVSCILTSPSGGITEDDVQCTASDELDSVIEILDDEERPVSSLIDIKSTKESLHSEFPSRFYIPHYPALSTGDEIVFKVSLNGSDWETALPLPSTSNISEHEKNIKRIAGLEVNDFSSVRVLVVCRPRSQTIVVDKPGVSVYSSMDKNLKVFVPRETFQKRTELRLTVKPIPEDHMSSFIKEIPSLENILSVNMFATLFCPKFPGKCIELDFLKGNQNKGETRRGKAYQLYATGEKVWRFADVEYKGRQDEPTITLPTGRRKYAVMEVEVPSSFPKENVLNLVEELYTCVNKTRARMIVRQNPNKPIMCVVRIVKEDQSKDAWDILAENGFTDGPDMSAPFNIQEGQHVDIVSNGNVEASIDSCNLVFLTYLGGVRADITLAVKDTWKQKDLPAYNGYIRCCILGEQGNANRFVEVIVSIPKMQRERTVIGFAPVRFPYYLVSLAVYVAHNVCSEGGEVWQDFLNSLLGEKEFHTKFRLAQRKLSDKESENICKTILLDWMKGQAAQNDKIVLVTKALEKNKMYKLARDCYAFIQYQKEHLTDDVLKEIASATTKDIQTLGKELSMDANDVERCLKEYPNDQSEQRLALLMAWRESDDVVKYGNTALELLKKICL